MRAADSEVEPPSRELARIAEIDVDALLMLACEIAGLSVQNRDDLVRRNGDRVRETWLAVIELDEIERRIVEDDAAEHVAVGEKAKIILGEGSDPIAIVDVEICERRDRKRKRLNSRN